MKRGGILFLFVVLSCINFVMADVTVGDESHYLETDYGPSNPIIGWVNISLENEPSDTLVTILNYNETLVDFLETNDASYSCLPINCENDYSASSGTSSKSFSLEEFEENILGIKLTFSKDLTAFTSLEFDLSTNAPKSCYNPLKIDILDDDSAEWKAVNTTSDSNCFMINSHGCYREADSAEDTPLVKDTAYCQIINVPPGKGFEVGAEISGTGNAEFTMSLGGTECDVNISSGGEIGCDVIFDEELEDFAELDACMTVKELNGNAYKIQYEDVNTCGYSQNGGKHYHDFEIFVKPLKYDALNDFKFDENLIGGDNMNSLFSDIENFLNNKYGGNCSAGCVIPIKFYSGVDQSIQISNLKLDYSIEGLVKSETKIYEIAEGEPVINADFQKLDLGNLNIFAPATVGSEDVVLEIGSEEIFEEEINVRGVPTIIGIYPSEVPILVPVVFAVSVKDPEANLTYTWNFGDGSLAETTYKEIVEHMYSELKTYNLSVKVSNVNGDAIKTIQVNTVSPRDYINNTIKEYRGKLRNVNSKLDNLQGWIKDRLYKEIGMDDLEAEIDAQEKRYQEGFIEDEEAVKIMKTLLNLKIPNDLDVSQSSELGDFVPDADQLDFDILDEIGVGIYEDSEESYTEGVIAWLVNNMRITFEAKTYSLYFENASSQTLDTYFRFILEPKNEVEVSEFYFIVNGDPSRIIYTGNVNNRDVGERASQITFFDLIETTTIEFLYPGSVDLLNIPVYVSPAMSDIEFEESVYVECNNNGICEEGENYKNCRSDCKPLKWTLVLLLVLFFIAFVIYIVLQEWYKRYYESHLFPKRNQLFNLINFMNNSLTQGLKKSEVYDNLKKFDWSKEQLDYAWNKLHGKRTGMWEIPIFKWVENRQVRKELKKRQGLNLGPDFERPSLGDSRSFGSRNTRFKP